MTDPANGTSDHLERNVEKLLSRTERALAMPDEAKRRALRALLEEGARMNARAESVEPERAAGPRRWSWLAAAAAILLIATVLFWPGSLESGVAWADVVRHLHEVQTLVARVTAETVMPTGERFSTRAMLYQKDPGQSRSETYAVTGDEAIPPAEWPPNPDDAESIVILSRGENEATILRLLPRERLAYRTHLSFTGDAAEARAKVPRDMVADSWAKLAGIASDRTRRIGERQVDGTPAVGFEADIRDVFPDAGSPTLEGVMRVWADAASGVPLEIEAEFRDPSGAIHDTRIGHLEWNAPLDDALFRVPEEGGWRVVDEREGPVEFTRTSLREGVTLNAGPPGCPPVLTERDIEAVVSGLTTRVPGESKPRTTILLTTTPEGERKLRAYTSEHLGEWLKFDFNGEASFRVRIGGVIGRHLQLDVTPLGKTAEEFETAYLTD